MVYNFSPSFVVCCLAFRWLWKVRLVIDLEDVASVRLADWISDTGARPVQEFVNALCMRAELLLCDAVIAPTRRFLSVISRTVPSAVVTGCFEDIAPLPLLSERPGKRPLRVLMAGGLDAENGLDLFCEAAQRFSAQKGTPEVEFHACGHLPAGAVLPAAVVCHGALPAAEYRDLLTSADVCVSLQNPGGRWAGKRTPSKVYEFLAAGRLVVATNAGDFVDIAGEFLRLCEPYTVEKLVEILQDISGHRDEIPRWRRDAWNYANSTCTASHVGQTLVPVLMSPAQS